MSCFRAWTACLLVIIFAGCERNYAAEPIHLGEDSCEHCRMTIVDARYGGELITSGGKVHKFDTLECLSKYKAKSGETPAAMYAVDFAHPGNYLRLDSALLVHWTGAQGPMGATVVAFADHENAQTTLHLPDLKLVTLQNLGVEP